MCSTVQEQITTCGQNAIVKIGEQTNIRPQKVVKSRDYQCKKVRIFQIQNTFQWVVRKT